MKAFNSNFLSAMHGFRDNEILLHTGNDVIVIPARTLAGNCPFPPILGVFLGYNTL